MKTIIRVFHTTVFLSAFAFATFAVPVLGSSSAAQPNGEPVLPATVCGSSLFSSGFESACDHCGAPGIVSAMALGSTAVCVEFSQLIDPSSVLANGQQFVIDGGLSSVSATPMGSGVIVNTATQTSLQSYTVVVSANVTNHFGAGVDPIENTASFEGFDSGPTQHCGLIDSDETWELNALGHLVTCDVTVQGDSPTLTIEDGAQIEFAPGTGLYIGTSLAGNLSVQGSSLGVDMASTAASPQTGDWSGLVVGTMAGQVSLTGLNVEHAANGIVVRSQDVTLSAVGVSNSQFDGLRIESSGSVAMTDSAINSNDGDGIYCDTAHCLGSGFAGNTITANAGFPVSLSTASDLQKLGGSSTFTGNASDFIKIRNTTSITQDATWQAQDVAVLFQGSLDVSGDTLLTIADMNLIFDGSVTAHRVRIRNLANLQVDNTVFTSIPESNGAWKGLEFESGSSGALTNSTFLYGGNPDAIELELGTAITITDNHIAHSNGFGIYCQGGCTGYGGTIFGNTFADNLFGDISP